MIKRRGLCIIKSGHVLGQLERAKSGGLNTTERVVAGFDQITGAELESITDTAGCTGHLRIAAHAKELKN